MKKILWFMGLLGGAQLAFSSTPYRVDEQSVRFLGNGCSGFEYDDVFIDVDKGAVSILFSELTANAVDAVDFRSCKVIFDVYADENYKIATPQVEMGVDYSIDDGGKGIATAKMTSLGESRTAKVQNVYGVGSKIIKSPLAKRPRYSQCGGKVTMVITARVTAFAPAEGGFSTVTIEDANAQRPYSISCPIIANPCFGG